MGKGKENHHITLEFVHNDINRGEKNMYSRDTIVAPPSGKSKMYNA